MTSRRRAHSDHPHPRRPSPSSLAISIGLAAVLLTAAVFVPATSAQDAASYRLGPRDRVQVRVAELDDFDRELEVSETGTIELPVIGIVDAEGRTEDELTEEIRRRLESQGLRRATVRLRIVDFRSRPVSVLGAVMEPGQQFIPGRATLLEVLLGAGGLARDHGQAVQVRRRASNDLADAVEIPVTELFETGDPAVNIPIYAGDVIHVPRARQIQVSFLGEVATPGTVVFGAGERVTLLVAIARVGGLTDTASPKLRVLRREGGREVEIEANFKRIVAGREADVPLEDGDIVVVKEAFF